MYVDAVDMTGFRCFGKARIKLENPDKGAASTGETLPNVTLLVGDNGAGKTTVLKAIALSVLAPVIQSSGYKPYYLVRRTREGAVKTRCSLTCQLALHGQDVGDGFTAQADSVALSVRVQTRGSYETLQPGRRQLDIETIFDDASPAFFMVGYGATRRVETVEHLNTQTGKQRGLRYQRVAGLFEEYITLRPLSSWLDRVRTAHRQRFREILGLFEQLLPTDTVFKGIFRDEEPVFRHKGVELPFGALSDGYRGYVGLLGDLLYHLHECCPGEHKLTDMSGVVMVDDIDLHLHPLWQRTVVPDLARTFARLQFVLTTHSPLVASTLRAANLRTIENAKIHQYQERIHGLSADQVLTSSYFNLPTPRPAEMERKLTRLSQKVERNDVQSAIVVLQELNGKSAML